MSCISYFCIRPVDHSGKSEERREHSAHEPALMNWLFVLFCQCVFVSLGWVSRGSTDGWRSHDPGSDLPRITSCQDRGSSHYHCSWYLKSWYHWSFGISISVPPLCRSPAPVTSHVSTQTDLASWFLETPSSLRQQRECKWVCGCDCE